MDSIYLDYNATSPIAPEVTEALLPFLREHWGNPSSTHVYGQRAKQGVVTAREQVAAMLKAEVGEIIFTSGGTESNNHALRGILELAPSSRRKLVISAVEHPAITNVADYLARIHGVEVAILPVDREGVVDLAVAAQFIDQKTALVSIMHANNETGALQPIAQLAELAHAQGALMHTDAAQSVGKVPVHVDALGVDLLSIAGHTLYAPKGIGALYIRKGASIAPFMIGAAHESGRRAGTENVPYMVGLGEAARLVEDNLAEEMARLGALRDRFETGLREVFPALHINGPLNNRLPNTAHVSFVGLSGAMILEATPQVAASTGAACKSGGTEPSGVLAAMGATGKQTMGAVRFSLGRYTRAEDIEGALLALRVSLKKASS
jgi:cysteine desulfurase